MKTLIAAILAMAISTGLALPFADAAEEAKGKEAGAEAQAPADEKGGGGAEEAAPAEVKPLEKGPMIELVHGRLSVDIRDQVFGDVVTAISNAAGFDVELSNDIFQKRLTTRFKNTELERGLLRMLSLMEQKNYFISYNPDGSIKKLEVYGDLRTGTRTMRGGSAPAVSPVPTSPGQTSPPVVAPRRTRTRPAQPVQRPTKAEKPAQEEKVIEQQFIIDTTGTGETTTTPTVPSASEPEEETPPPGDTTPPGEDYIEEEIIPEGELPPESSLLNAPYMPPSRPPATP